MAKRTDIHRDSVLVPTDYEFLFDYGVFSVQGDEGWEKEDYGTKELNDALDSGKVWAGQVDENHCAACGTHYVHGVAYLHRPSGEIVFIGHTCAQKLNLAVDMAAWRRRYADAQRRMSLYLKRRSTYLTFKKELLAQTKEVRLAFRSAHRIVRDILAKGLRFGSLSAKQYELVAKIRRDELTPKIEEKLVAVPEGRHTVEGLVVSTKFVEGFVEGSETLKMLVRVETPEGVFKVFGTAPDALLDGKGPLKGRRVRFAAAFQPKELGFGFFKRPTKAQLLEPAAEVAA